MYIYIHTYIYLFFYPSYIYIYSKENILDLPCVTDSWGNNWVGPQKTLGYLMGSEFEQTLWKSWLIITVNQWSIMINQ